MLTPMKRSVLALIILCLVSRMWAASNIPSQALQPFNSVKELGSIDFSKPLAANQEAWVDQTSIKLLTIGPGDPLYAWFGHSALIVTQPSGTQIMYDWGIFDTQQKYFYLNFARGRMYYYVLASEATWRIEEALSEMRDVKLLELNFPKEAKFAIISFLQKNIKSEYSTYLYHFYRDNCATRIRDIIDAGTNGAFKAWAQAESTGLSYRQLDSSYMIHSPALFWVLDFLQGRTIDAKLNRYEELYLPEKLEQAVLDFTYPDGSKLARNVQVLRDTSHLGIRAAVAPSTARYDWQYFLVGLGIALLLYLAGRWNCRLKTILLGLLFLTLGLLGSLLLFMMLCSDMDMTYFNENILFVNPLLLISAVGLLRGKTRHPHLVSFSAAVMIILLVLKIGVPSLALQDNIRVIALLLPLYLSGSSLQRRGNRDQL